MLDDDVLLEVFRKVTCSRTLRRASLACKHWHVQACLSLDIFRHTWLTVTSTTITDALSHAPEGERILIRSGSTLTGPLVCARAVHLKAEPGVLLRGQLVLQGCNQEAVVSVTPTAARMHACAQSNCAF